MSSALQNKPIVLPESAWRERVAAHLEQAQAFTSGPRLRRDRGQRHPVEDFLFDYYPYPIALIEQWHPEHGTVLEFSDLETFPIWFQGKNYSVRDGKSFADIATLSNKGRDRLEWINSLLKATQSHVPNFACYGLHEWAMVYRAEEIRHSETAPLRLPQAEIDTLIESRSINCSHHDAFRFFAKSARPFNRIQPSLESRLKNEQPGCVHANMDLYKWAAKAMPWIGSELFFESFRLATQLRELDMRASPYDLSKWNIDSVKIETGEGRREYEAEQRRLAADAMELRARMIRKLSAVLAAT